MTHSPLIHTKTYRWASGAAIQETSIRMMEAGADLCFPSGSAPVVFLERICNFQNHSAELSSLWSVMDVEPLKEIFGSELQNFITELRAGFEDDFCEIVRSPKNIANTAHKIKGAASQGRCYAVERAASELEIIFKQSQRTTKTVEGRALQKLYYAIKNLRIEHSKN